MVKDIPISKFFSHQLNRAIDLEQDGCDFADWESSYSNKLFARHPKKFFVFLSPDEIESSNEYDESDPYSVEENINSDFQLRRIECTLDLIKDVLGNTEGKFRLLDIGCGQGHITNKILQHFPEAEISGLDYSLAAIEYAVEHFPGIDFAVGNAYRCPYSPNYFDLVICNNLWEHVPDPIHLLSKISVVLKKGGYIIISTPSRYRLSNIINILRRNPIEFISKHHVTEYSVGQVVEQLKYGGFKIRKIYSKHIKTWSIKSLIFNNLLSSTLWLLKSHHQLESTVFYLAQENRDGYQHD